MKKRNEVTWDDYINGIEVLEGNLETLTADIKRRSPDVRVEEYAAMITLCAVIGVLKGKLRESYETYTHQAP